MNVQYRKTVLANGLTILTERHPETRSLSMGVWVKTGARHEPLREAGVSHCLEHMLFRGTRHRSGYQISSEIDRAGGEFNAYTSTDYTSFVLLLLERDLGLGADILCDILLNSLFERTEFEREKKVILQELSMVQDAPEELVFDLFYTKVYGNHGLGRPILGTPASIRRIRRDDVVRYFRRHYRPSNLVISVAGDVTHEAVLKAFRPLAGDKWPGRRSARVPPGARARGKAPKVRHGFWWMPRDSEQTHLVWGVAGPAYSDRDRVAAALLNAYFGGNLSSLLFQEVREKHGLAYNVYSNLMAFDDSGLFMVYAATKPSDTAKCLELIEECALRMCVDELTPDQLKILKESLKGMSILGDDGVEAWAASNARNEIIYGRRVTIEEVCAAIDQVTARQIRDVSRRLFGSGPASGRSLMAIGPKPTKHALTRLRGWGRPHYYRT